MCEQTKIDLLELKVSPIDVVCSTPIMPLELPLFQFKKTARHQSRHLSIGFNVNPHCSRSKGGNYNLQVLRIEGELVKKKLGR
jgi:hypothetical protein